METRLDKIIKDYYTNDGESLSKNLSLYDMESMEYARLSDDPSLAAIRPEIRAAVSSSDHQSNGLVGSHKKNDGFPMGTTHMLFRAMPR